MNASLSNQSRCVVLLATAALTTATAFAHPGEHLDLKVRLNEQRIQIELLISHDLADRILDFSDTTFSYDRAADRYSIEQPAQAERIRDALHEFIRTATTIEPDGVPVDPILKSIEFIQAQNPFYGMPPHILTDVEFDQIAKVPPDLVAIIDYPVLGKPRRCSLIWHYYPEDRTRVAQGLPARPAFMAQVDAFEERKIVMFSHQEPEYIWHANFKPPAERIETVAALRAPRATLPILSLGLILLACVGVGGVWRSRKLPAQVWIPTLLLVGVGAAWLARGITINAPWTHSSAFPNDVDAAHVFETLHRNVYRAFDYKSESDVYDVLERSVAGDLLDRVYNEVYQSLIMHEHGGAVAKVHSVDITETELLSTGVEPESGAPAFQIEADWQVYGVVVHWGHMHTRTNRYRAIYNVAERNQDWKITDVEILEQQRLDDDGALPEAARSPRADEDAA